MTYGFIGTGNMGGALARAAAKTVEVRSCIVLANRTPEKAAKLADEIGASVADNLTVARECDYILLGVKPQMMAGMLAEIAPVLRQRTTPFVLLSMAAGLTVARIREMAGGDYPVIRIMPNTAVAVGEGVTLYCCSDNVTDAQQEGFISLLHCSGLLEELDEKLIDAGSAVAGCGGAFAYLFLEALADGGVYAGLPRAKAQRYAAQMLLGAARLALESDDHTAALKDAVCSPGGTTIAGVRALEEHGGVRVLTEKEASGQALFQAAAEILRDDTRRSTMSRAMAALGVRDAAERIYETVQAVMAAGDGAGAKRR